MIDNHENFNPNQLAEEAKEKLEKQKKNQPTEDIYSEFRDENEQTTEDISEDSIQELYAKDDEEELPNINDEDLDEKYYEEQEDHPDIPPFEEYVCAGGPLKSSIETWKKQFDKSSIHLIEIGRYIFVVRTLSRPEYKRLLAMQNVNALQREEIICHTTVLFPQEFDYKQIATLDAGIPSTLADLIMERSGFTREFTIEVL